MTRSSGRAAPTPSFTLFNQLPCELRQKIWEDSLPESESNAVYFFRDWKWKPHIPATSNSNPKSNTPPSPMMETDDELGEDIVNPHVPIYLPQVLVNHEARAVALRWAARNGDMALQIHDRAWDEDYDAGGRIVVRPWQPAQDAVYICSEKWSEFCERPCTFPFDGQAAVFYGTVDCGYSSLSGSGRGAASTMTSSASSPPWSVYSRPSPHSVEIRTLAVPAADVRGRDLAGLLHCLPNLARLQLVYGPLPQPYEREEDAIVPRRWTLEDAHTRAEGVRPHYYTDAPMGGGRYAAREAEEPLVGVSLLQHMEDVERMLLREVKRCEVESEARDAVERDDNLPFTLEAVVFTRGL